MGKKKFTARDVVIEGKWRIRGDRSQTGAEFQTGASIAGTTRLAYGNWPWAYVIGWLRCWGIVK